VAGNTNQICEYELIAHDSLSSDYGNLKIEHWAVIDEGVKLSFFATRIDAGRQGGEEVPIKLASDEFGIELVEFLRRFFLHVLPKGFVCIGHFGFLSNRFRASRLALGRHLLAYSGSTEHEVRAHDVPESSSLWHCPRCGASMIVIQRFTAAELSACMYFDSS
jgi:Putative transposase